MKRLLFFILFLLMVPIVANAEGINVLYVKPMSDSNSIVFSNSVDNNEFYFDTSIGGNNTKVEYKIAIQNTDDEIVTINSVEVKSSINKIKYSISNISKDEVIKPLQTKEFTLTALTTSSNTVEESDNVVINLDYKVGKDDVISSSGDKDKVSESAKVDSNPPTGIFENYLLFSIIGIVFVVGYLSIKKKTKFKSFVLILAVIISGVSFYTVSYAKAKSLKVSIKGKVNYITSVQGTSGNTTTIGTNPIKLSDYNIYKLSIDANGGKYYGLANYSENVKEGYKVDLRYNLVNGSKKLIGYTLNGTHYDIEGNEIITVSMDTNIVVEWSTDNYYVITIIANNGSYEGSSDNLVIKLKKGESYELTDPVRDGYNFKGWEELSSTNSLNGKKITANSDNIVLRAKWEANKYNVTIDPQGGSVITNKIVVSYGSPYEKIPGISRNGYTFIGWYLDNNKITNSDIVTKMEDHTLVAKWEAKKYVITFDPNKGSVNPTTKEILSDQLLGQLPEPTNYPVPGFKFRGWYLGDKLVDANTKFDSYKNITLVAKWSNVYNISLSGEFELDDNDDDQTGTGGNTGGGSGSGGSTGGNTGGESGTGGSTGGNTGGESGSGGSTGGNTGGESGTGGSTGGNTGGESGTGGSTGGNTGGNTGGESGTGGSGSDGGSSTGGGSSNPSSEVGYKQKYNLPTPKRRGYIFAGWWTQETGGRQITNDDVFDGTDDITLYARWTPRDDTKYVVKHWKQKIDGNIASFDDTNYSLEESYELQGTTDSTVTPEVESYSGFRSPQASTLVISPNGDAVKNYYYTRNTYQLTVATSTGVESTTGSGTYSYEKKVAIGYKLKPGYVFSKYVDSNNNEFTASNYRIPATNSTVTVYATPIKYNIKYNSSAVCVEDNSNSTCSYTQYTGTNEIAYDAAFNVGNATKSAGWSFVGWNISGMDNTLHTIGNSTTTDKEVSKVASGSFKNLLSTPGEVVFTPVFSREVYKITLDPNGGSLPSGSASNISRKYGVAYGDLATPQKTGYSFAGWYTSASGGTAVTSTTTATGDTTIYAHWTPNTFTITYVSTNANANQSTSGYVNTTTCTYDQNCTLSSNGFSVTEAGYVNTFRGWVINGKTYEAGANVKNIATSGNVNAQASWGRALATYTVSFYGNGGTTPNNQSVTYTKAYGTLPTPTRANYTFVGWTDGNGRTITSDSVHNITSDIRLTAQWREYLYIFNNGEVNGYTLSHNPVDATKAYDYITVGSTISYSGRSINDLVYSSKVIPNNYSKMNISINVPSANSSYGWENVRIGIRPTYGSDGTDSYKQYYIPYDWYAHMEAGPSYNLMGRGTQVVTLDLSSIPKSVSGYYFYIHSCGINWTIDRVWFS